jgi:hypothetical protein
MRLFIRVLLCGICIGVAYFFFLQQPAQKSTDSNDYLVIKKHPGGSQISSHRTTGESLNSAENFGYGAAILIFGCGLILSLTKKEKGHKANSIPLSIFVLGFVILLYSTYNFAELAYLGLLIQKPALFIFLILLNGIVLGIAGVSILSRKKWAWWLSVSFFLISLVLSLNSYRISKLPLSLYYSGGYVFMLSYLCLIKKQFQQFSRPT